MKPPMAPSPSPTPQQPTPTATDDDKSTELQQQQRPKATSAPYSIPSWSEPPSLPFSLEVLKDGSIIDQLDISAKGAYMFGRVDLCDFILEHPTISRFHAVLQFKKDAIFLFDLGSTHGTFVNKIQVEKKVYKEVHVGDVIRFGLSSRLYAIQGPNELMPPERDLERIRSAKLRQEMLDREASLSRAKAEAALAEGISWGMGEDAIEEDPENGTDEITWQTYTGQLTERQEKTRGKIIKRMEKVANMRKEIDAIRAKDIAQGGLTQGQQTQIARNEQRMSQIMEELDSLEETLNESIQESLGARSGKPVHSKQKKDLEDDEEMLSDDDDFYDRTNKKLPTRKLVEQKSVETADTLLDKKENILGKMEELKTSLLKEQEKDTPSAEKNMGGGDDLDAYMAGLSSQIVHDRIARIKNELSDLQAELDKVIYLLKIADPLGEAAQKRGCNPQREVSKANVDTSELPPLEKKQSAQKNHDMVLNSENSSESRQADKHTEKVTVSEKPAFVSAKPQWLGATRDIEVEENSISEVHLDDRQLDSFVDYKDRNEVLSSVDDRQDLERAAPGLIIRKRKSVQMPGEPTNKAKKVEATSSAAESSASEAVALLLKHKRGYSNLDEGQEEEASHGEDKGNTNTQPKRVFGPSKPTFLDKNQEYETWLPPEGQSGDGRTSLNDRLGY